MSAPTCLTCGKRLTFRCDMEWVETPIPPCPHCGRSRHVCHEQVFNHTLARNEDGGRVFRCSNCEPDQPVPPGWKEREVKLRRRIYEKAGPYHDGFFCSLKCGHSFGVLAAKAGYRLRKKEEE